MGTVAREETSAFEAALVLHEQTTFFICKFWWKFAIAGGGCRICFRIRCVGISRGGGEWFLVGL